MATQRFKYFAISEEDNFQNFLQNIEDRVAYSAKILQDYPFLMSQKFES